MKKVKEKKEENYIKKGGKGLKNASFWAINSKCTIYIPVIYSRIFISVSIQSVQDTKPDFF